MWHQLLELLFPARPDESSVRGTQDDDFLAKLSPRLAETTIPATTVLLSYADASVQAAVREMKYHGTGRARELLALVLAEYLKDHDGSRALVLIPIPLGVARRHERGYNQVEEVMQRAITLLGEDAARFQIAPDVLIRTRETPSQVSLPREKRRTNMRGAFRVPQDAAPLDPTASYLVIDDVITTGATMQAALDALRAAGATNLSALALAH